MNNWISVFDQLPKDGILCLVYWHKDESDIVEIDYIDEEMWGEWFNRGQHFNIAGGNCNEEAPYTHWMPIPIPPSSAINEDNDK
jgi:hypothetical protein